jgi:DNA-binding NtrC family response regulator
MNGRKRVLVLDFDADLLIALERLLEDSGLHTVTTWDVEVAMGLLDTHYFDYFVVGNRPPELDAKQLLAEVRGRGVECGCFIMGSSWEHQDGYGNLIDQIRAFPCLPHARHLHFAEDDTTSSRLWRVEHGE